LRDWERVLVDDGSRDGTWNIVQACAAEDPRIKPFKINNSGTAAARNFGLDQSDRRTQFISFMDHDDLFLPDALDGLVNCAAAAYDCIGAHGLADKVDTDGRLLNPGRMSTELRQRLAIQGSSVHPLSPDSLTGLSTFIASAIFPPGVVILKRSVAKKSVISIAHCRPWMTGITGFEPHATAILRFSIRWCVIITATKTTPAVHLKLGRAPLV